MISFGISDQQPWKQHWNRSAKSADAMASHKRSLILILMQLVLFGNVLSANNGNLPFNQHLNLT